MKKKRRCWPVRSAENIRTAAAHLQDWRFQRTGLCGGVGPRARRGDHRLRISGKSSSTNRRTASSLALRRCWVGTPDGGGGDRRSGLHIEVDQKDIAVLLQHNARGDVRVLGRQFHASQLVRLRANRHPNDVIEKDATFGERIASPQDRRALADHGRSSSRSVSLTIYIAIDAAMGRKPWIRIIYSAESVSVVLASVQAPIIMMSQNGRIRRTDCTANRTTM